MNPINDRLDYDVFCLLSTHLDIPSIGSLACTCTKVAKIFEDKHFLEKISIKICQLPDRMRVIINNENGVMIFYGAQCPKDLWDNAVSLNQLFQHVSAIFTLHFPSYEASHYYYREGNDDKNEVQYFSISQTSSDEETAKKDTENYTKFNKCYEKYDAENFKGIIKPDPLLDAATPHLGE